MVGVKACFVFLPASWNYILFLGESKNGGCDEAIENCTFGEHLAVLANKSIYWLSPPLASESEQIQTFLKSESRQVHVLPPNASPSSSLSKDPVPITDVDINAAQETQSKIQGPSETMIDVRNASFGWGRTGTPQVNDVSFSLRRGKFLFIIGPVGVRQKHIAKRIDE